MKKTFFVLTIITVCLAKADYNDPNEFVDINNLLMLSDNWLNKTGAQGDFNLDYHVDEGDLNLLVKNWLIRENNNDPNSDPNSLPVLVDLNDFANLSSSWKKKINPFSMDLNYDGVVNLEDFWIMATLWQSPEIRADFVNLATGDTLFVGNLSGRVGLNLCDIPLWADIVEIYIGEELVAKWLRGENQERIIVFDTSVFSNGEHTINLVTKISYSGVNFPSSYKVVFNNLIHSIVANDVIDPNEPYVFSGVYDGTKTINAKVINFKDEVLWQDSFCQGEISISLPYLVFDANDICELVIIEDPNGFSPIAITSLSSFTQQSTSKEMHRAIVKSFDPNSNDFQMLIVLPYPDIYSRRREAVYSCIRACESRGVGWAAVYGVQANDSNLRIALPKARYVYWVGHGFNYVGQDLDNGIQGVRRTYQTIWRNTKKGWWDIVNNWEEIGAFSWTRQTLNDEILPSNWDQRGFDVWGLGMSRSVRKKIVFIDACSSLVFADMARAYGMESLAGEGHKDQIYIGWSVQVHASSGVLSAYQGDISGGIATFWEKLGHGYSVEYALGRISIENNNSRTPYAFWGHNHQMDLGELGGDDHLYVWGNGFVNISKIKLGW